MDKGGKRRQGEGGRQMSIRTAMVCGFLAVICSEMGLAADANKPQVAADNFTCLTNVPYGPDPENVLDLWLAKSDKPTPLVVYFHGGGFYGGDKSGMENWGKQYSKNGISFASANYRLTPKVIYPAPFMDCVRAIQFLRANAAKWNLDAGRVAGGGRSAGAGMALWIAFHKDFAEPRSDDPVARQSTRLTCVAVENAQASYDPRFIKEHIPGNAYRDGCNSQLFGLKDNEILNPPPDKARLMEDGAPINQIAAGAPPVMITYERASMEDKDKPGDMHHVRMGILLKEKLDAARVECVLVTQSPADPRPSERVSTGAEKSDLDFFLRHFGMSPRK